jgi:hypothetical protein
MIRGLSLVVMVGIAVWSVPLLWPSLSTVLNGPPSSVHPVGFEAVAAKKKKKKLTDAEITTLLEPITKDINGISTKVKSRRLLSPEENEKLMAAYDTLSGLMQDASGNPQLLAPLYQLGVLFTARQNWLEAYDSLDYVAKNYANTPYAARAQRYLIQVHPHVEAFLPPEPTLEPGTAPAKPGSPAVVAPASAKKP